MELREFLSQRQQELNSETTNILLAGQVSIWSDSSLLSPSLPFMDSWCQIARVVPLCMATIAGFPAHFYCMHTHRTTFAMKQATRMDGSLWMSACSSSLEFSTTDKQTFKQLLLVTWYCLPLQFGSSSDGLEVQSSEAVGEMLGHVTQVLDLLTNSRTQHLFLIKGSPR